MKIALILLSFLFITNDIPLNFSELIFVYENDLNQVTSRLSDKGFVFEQTEKTEKGEDGIIWKYAGDDNDGFSLFVAKYCFAPNCGYISVQTDNINIYSVLKNQALENGFVYDNTYIDDYEKTDGIVSIYFKDKFILVMSEGKYKNGDGMIYGINLSKQHE